MFDHPSLRYLQRSLVVFVSGALCAQQATQISTSIPGPTIRVSTHMVLVDAVVTDKQGKAIAGLHPEDFVVEENGKVQKVSSLTTPAENAPVAAPALPPGIYSNRPQYRSPGGSINVILLDALNTPFADQAYARGQMLAFVKEHFRPTDRTAVFTLTGSLNVLQDFTSDPQVLYSTLQHFNPQTQTFANNTTATGPSTDPGPATATSMTASLDAATPPPHDRSAPLGLRGSGTNPDMLASVTAALQAFQGAQVAYAKDQWAILTLNSLNSLARILGGLPGRKNLIWVTGDLPFSFIPEDQVMTQAELEESLPSKDQRNVVDRSAGNYASTFRTAHSQEIRETASRLASAQVAVYPVDARGLSISTNVDSQETMREMARETGGRAYVNQNEIKLGVERAFEDELADYTLGYYPENKKYDGKYRAIKVRVKRDGVEVHSRRGYYAIDPTTVRGYNPQQEVVSAISDVVPSTMVAFTAQVKPPAENSVPGKIGVTYLVDASTLSAEDALGGERLNVAFYATIYSGGKIVANSSQKVDQTFDTNTYRQIVQKGLMLHLDLDPKPGQLRLAVQDARTGLVGTIHTAYP